MCFMRITLQCSTIRYSRAILDIGHTLKVNLVNFLGSRALTIMNIGFVLIQYHQFLLTQYDAMTLAVFIYCHFKRMINVH